MASKAALKNSAAPVFDVPKTDAEETAMRQALAKRTLAKLEQAAAFLEGDETVAFMEGLEKLASLNIVGYGAGSNVVQIAANIGTARQSLLTEIAHAKIAAGEAPDPAAIATPPAPPEE